MLCSYNFCPVLHLPFICFLFYLIKSKFQQKNKIKLKKSFEDQIQRQKNHMIFTQIFPRIYSKWAEVERRNDVSSDGKERRNSGVSSLKWVLDQIVVISNVCISSMTGAIWGAFSNNNSTSRWDRKVFLTQFFLVRIGMYIQQIDEP